MAQTRLDSMGTNAYVFVSYSHADEDVVLNEIRSLQNSGIKTWYDATGIGPGSEWTSEIARAIKGAEQFLYFVTPSSVESENCRREVSFAQSENIPLVVTHLVETELPDGLRLSLDNRQAILKYRLGEDTYRNTLLRALTSSSLVNDTSHDQSVLPKKSTHTYVRFMFVAILCLVLIGGIWYHELEPEPARLFNPKRELFAKPVYLAVEGSGAFDQALKSSLSSVLAEFDGFILGDSVEQNGLTITIERIGSETEGRVTATTRDANGQVVLPFQADLAEYEGSALDITDALSRDYGFALAGHVDREIKYFEPQRPPGGDIAAYNAYRLAEMEYYRGNLQEAARLSEAAIKAEAGYLNALITNAKSHWTIADTNPNRPPIVDLQLAAESISRAREVAPEHAFAAFLQGKVTVNLELDFGKALSLFHQAEQLGYVSAWNRESRAELYLNTGRYEDAVALHEAVIAADPTRNPVLLARALSRIGRVKEATEMYQRALKVEGPMLSITVNFALGHFATHAPQLAEELASSPKADHLVLARTMLGSLNGKPERQIELLQDLILESEHRYVSPSSIAWGSYTVGLYSQHMEWFRKSVADRASTAYTYEFMYGSRADYWKTLHDWAKGNLNRLDQVQTHRSYVAKTFRKMHLGRLPDFD
ncbi:MAG: TIR domain-containing protein [Pseudomonadales bacterium]|nr:TIR domain-containing protein [Pseudomonadales bacterium]